MPKGILNLSTYTLAGSCVRTVLPDPSVVTASPAVSGKVVVTEAPPTGRPVTSPTTCSCTEKTLVGKDWLLVPGVVKGVAGRAISTECHITMVRFQVPSSMG